MPSVLFFSEIRSIKLNKIVILPYFPWVTYTCQAPDCSTILLEESEADFVRVAISFRTKIYSQRHLLSILITILKARQRVSVAKKNVGEYFFLIASFRVTAQCILFPV
jgi:hypothetical protein